MEEVPDEIPDLEPAQEYEELEETIPEPPPLKRANKLTEKVTCEGCGKTMASRTYRYSHRCKPQQAVTEEPKPKRIDREKLKEAMAGSSMTEKQSTKPVKSRALINRVPEYREPEPPYQPNQDEIYSHLLHQRQQQAYLRHQAMLQPYEQMFASWTH